MTATSIAIDAMGGDHGPSIIVPAALQALGQYPHIHIILVGQIEILQKILHNAHYDTSRLSVVAAAQTIAMDESPALALRNKKDSSMRVAINLVKEGRAQACVSAGNTGALMATARFVLKTLPGVDRPAIISAYPVYDPARRVRVLDLGANVDSTPENLVQFAIMGSELTKASDNIERPSIYLLNVGEEEIKGNEVVKKTASLLAVHPTLNYKGFIEADAIYSGKADVIVCDGFVGNISLKTMEGVARMIGRLIKEAFMHNLWTKMVGLLVKPVLKPFMKRIDPGRYNGATFIGLNGIVIKSHGSANQPAFLRAIEEAMIEVEHNIPERIKNEVEASLKSSLPPEGH